ncbi:MAG: hypothetical protein NTX50_17215, partial [Candidatus Sumerlaeota bacterium]|nr:hypothetical protein [Candidatus Sumerlaeota bacterium]
GALDIGNILVDKPQLVTRRFSCDTCHCVHALKNGKRKGSCCTDLEVDLTPNEIHDVRRLALLYLKSPIAQVAAPECIIARRILQTNDWLNESDCGEPCLAHTKERICSLGYLDADGRLLCALNAMTAALGEPLPKWKMMTCYVFPLHYVEYQNDKYLLTILCRENYQYLGADVDVARLRCLAQPQPDAPPAYQSLQGEIEFLLGAAFYLKLRERLELKPSSK